MAGLPKDFETKMQNLLDDEFEAFLESYDKERALGLRANPLKIAPLELRKISSFKLMPIPWERTGFYYSPSDRPGKHPYHDAGLYYIQEPSAMVPASLLGAQPGERILDLCAAPGGKSTHLAGLMDGAGVLVCNEIHPARAKILSQNIERMGITNAVVLNETPGRLAERFFSFFDRILIDAPCSGEGMFRKASDTREEWSSDNVTLCATRQKDILKDAVKMLRPGGRLVYSTCTFSPEENEGVINWLISEYCFSVLEVSHYDGFGKGRPEWIDGADKSVSNTIRIWPHRVRGEGHFVAVLQKADSEELRDIAVRDKSAEIKPNEDYNRFMAETLNVQPTGVFQLFGDQLYLTPQDLPALHKIKVVRAGWHLGTMKKGRFEPSHALALAIQKEDATRICDFKHNSEEISAYLKGHSIITEGDRGWNLVTVDGYPIGWGKISDGILKNHYPKGLRWL